MPNKKLSRTDEQFITIGKMTRGLVHDFNNSLASIMGYSDFLITDLDKGSEQHQFAVNINKAALQMQLLLQQITALTKETQENTIPINILKTTEQIAENFFQSLPLTHRGVFETQEIDAHCTFPLIKFQTLINNILMNAYQSLGNNGGEIRVNITANNPFTDKKDDYLFSELVPINKDSSEYIYICVSDTGCGMDKDVLEYAIEPYFSTNKAETSHGIGLTICCGIVKAMGGGISIRTKKGKGTSVLITLPVKIYHNIKVAYKSKNIILIEDRDVLRQSQKTIMLRAGHNVNDFSNIWDAFDYIRENYKTIDLIICDLSMPSVTDANNSTGEDLLNELKFNKLNIPVIFISGDLMRLQVLQKNNLDKNIQFLSKPFQSEDLLCAINMTFN